MRHFYFRLIFGVILLMIAIVSAVPFALLYAALGIVYLYSAYKIRK